jgi:hypothetical protein
MLSVIDLGRVLAIARPAFLEVSSIGIAVISLVAATCVVVGCSLACRKWRRLLAASVQAEERRAAEQDAGERCAAERQDQCERELRWLLEGLEDLVYSLCNTDELIEAWREDACAEQGVEYQAPGPVAGAEDLFIEVRALQKVLLQLLRNLEEGRILSLESEFYRRWVASLRERSATFRERKQAIDELERLQARLEHLEQVLIRVHGAREMTWQEAEDHLPGTMETYQDVYTISVYERKLMEWRIEGLKDARAPEASGDISRYSNSVELLERFHEEVLDGGENLFGPFTRETILHEAYERWQDVIHRTGPAALLEEYLAVSHRKYLEGYTQARRAFLNEGPCGQKKAVERYRMALRHWSCCQALLLVIREQLDAVEDLTDPRTLSRYAREFDEALSRKCEQDLQALETSLEAFHARFPVSCPSFLL